MFRREVNVDAPVSLASVASLIQGEYLTLAVASVVMTLGWLIEQATSESARKAIKALIWIAPKTTTRGFRKSSFAGATGQRLRP